MDRLFTIDENKLVFEIFDTEVVLVSLDSGHYFVLEQSAGDIWRCLARGLSVADTTGLLSQRYAVETDALQRDVEALLGQLVVDELLAPAVKSQTPVDAISLPEQVSPALLYKEPFMFKYTEMENLIQMDPIREVDESGWPKRRTFPKKK